MAGMKFGAAERYSCHPSAMLATMSVCTSQFRPILSRGAAVCEFTASEILDLQSR